MNVAHVNDSEAEVSGSNGFLDFLKVGADIYRTSRSDPAALPAPAPAVPRPGLAAPVPWYKKPLVWVGAAGLVLVGWLLVRRK